MLGRVFSISLLGPSSGGGSSNVRIGCCCNVGLVRRFSFAARGRRNVEKLGGVVLGNSV